MAIAWKNWQATGPLNSEQLCQLHMAYADPEYQLRNFDTPRVPYSMK